MVAKDDIKNYFNAALLALPWLGVQTIWATEFGVLVQTLQGYGLSQSVASLAWIFGPITGFFVAPLIGVFSDNNTSKYGRRRPYIIAGLLSTVVCSLLFAFSESLGATKEAHLAVGFFSFVGLDITINIMQTPLRALGSDLAPLGFQEAVQLFAALFQGLGGILGSVIMKAFYTGYANELPKVFLTVMAINLSLITFICLVVKEEQYVPKAGQDKPTAAKAIFGAFSGIAKMDKKMAIICAIEFFSWAALFAWWPSASTWWAVNVYGGCRANNTDCLEGSVGEKAYRDGNTAYGDSGIYANLVQTFLSLLLSVALSFGLLKQVKIPYAFCLLVGAAMLILSKIGPQTVFVGYLVAILVAVPIAAIQSFPFAIVGNYNKGKPENETGLQMGILNIFICLPQIIITFVVTALSETYGVQGIPWTLFAGGFCFGIAGILALFIQGADASEIKHSIETGEIKENK
ncbi:major facilitator superfamily domain-containing protein [Gorgonomyces haynaldii]|nr:major facilitator superfamily domain-containing protein [Gorgonomyces haynaldii]